MVNKSENLKKSKKNTFFQTKKFEEKKSLPKKEKFSYIREVFLY